MKKVYRGKLEELVEENWTVKPLNDEEQYPTQSNLEYLSTSPLRYSERNAYLSTIPISDLIRKNPKSASNRRKSKEFYRNRDAQVVKTPESEVGTSFPSKEENGEEKEERENEGTKDGCASVNMDNSTEQVNETSDPIEDINHVSNRLEELKLVAQEPELSDEQLRINDELQKDEIEVMESIFGESFIKLDREDGLRSFQLYISIEVPDGVTISTNLYSPSGMLLFEEQANETTVGTDNLNELFYSFEVRNLPPVVLTCLLPKSYPSHISPYFTISVQWLAPTRISSLCNMLDSIWMNQFGQEVITHKWVEWLQYSSLSHLGFDKEIILGPYNMPQVEDRRVVSGNSPANADICHEIFRQNLHECSVCYEEYAGTEFARLPCKHFSCLTCLEKNSNMHVKEGTVNKLFCLAENCGGSIPTELLRRLLGNEKFERWELLMSQKTHDSMSNLVYCPRCKTSCLEDEDHHAQCTKCFFSFCSLCRERRHVGVECMTPEMKLQILQERQSLSQLNDEQIRKEREMIDEILSVKEVLRDAKQCPSCKMAISRIEGCNKMKCENCGEYFCYRCNKAIDGDDHFMRFGGCTLFPTEPTQELEDKMNEHQLFDQLLSELSGPDHAQPCPNCSEENPKVDNNNHIHCRSCHIHYCNLCRKIVRSSLHYGPKGCKQHTTG